MNSYEELAVSQPVTKMKVEVEKQMGLAAAQPTPTRSRTLEQKEEIFSKEIRGIIQRLEEQERLNAAEGSGSSSPPLTVAAKKGRATSDKRLGDQISFTDVSFLCSEMSRGSVVSLVKAWNSGHIWQKDNSRNLKDLTMDEWKQLAEASQRHFPSIPKGSPTKTDPAPKLEGGQQTANGADAASSGVDNTSTTPEVEQRAGAGDERDVGQGSKKPSEDGDDTSPITHVDTKPNQEEKEKPDNAYDVGGPEGGPGVDDGVDKIFQQPSTDQPDKDATEVCKSLEPADDVLLPTQSEEASTTETAVEENPKPDDPTSEEATRPVDNKPQAETSAQAERTEQQQEEAVPAVMAVEAKAKGSRVVIANDAAVVSNSVDTSTPAAAAPGKGWAKGTSRLDTKEGERKLRPLRRGHVRAASMGESLRSLVTGGGSRIEGEAGAKTTKAGKREKEPVSSSSLSSLSSSSSSSLSTSSPMISSPSLASSASGGKDSAKIAGGGSALKEEVGATKKESTTKKKSKWDMVRGLRDRERGAPKDRSETIGEDVIAAAKRDPSSTRKDSLRPHLIKHNSEKLDRMLVRRPSYKVLVEQGYIKEWGDEADVDSSTAAAARGASPRGALKRSPTFNLVDTSDDVGEEGRGDDDGDEEEEDDEESLGKSLIHNVQLLPTDSLWHVERGSKRDFIPGAYLAFENDQELVPYYKKFFYQKEHENYWGRDERLGPVLVSIEGNSTRGSARILRRAETTMLGGPAPESTPTAANPALSRENSHSSLSLSVVDNDAPSTSGKAKRRSAILMPRKSSNASMKESKDVITKEGSSSLASSSSSAAASAPSWQASSPSVPSSSSTSASSGLLSHLGKDAFKLGGWKTKSEIFSVKARQPGGGTLTWRVLLQTKKGALQFFIRSGASKADKHRAIKIACGSQGIPELQELKFKPVKSPTFPEDMVKLEKAFLDHDEYKFGVLYGREGQSENEMFANMDTSPEFERFLQLLGDRVTLKGWNRYTGGLDVKRDSTGRHSVFREFRDLEIMFHVAPLLPFYPDDTQHVERKRHLGNDIVVIIFLEGGTFTPSMIKTKFNHIYAVVAVDRDEITDEIILSNGLGSAPRVRVEFASREGVRPYGATIPGGYHFALDEKFIDFLLTKLVNGQRAALHAPVFAKKLEMTRSALMEDLIKDWA